MNSTHEKPARIRWPQHYDPAEAPVFVRNELHIDAAPETVWAWLVRAPLWPQWYANSHHLRIVNGNPSALAPGSRFVWTTFGIRLQSEVKEFVSGERLAWDAKAFGVDAYHAWLLTPTSDGGCLVLTEETQHGFIARGGALLFPKRMFRWHQTWLESLSERALGGLPASA
jgi:uncharacterized protein YndB with AHSA1/START domain